MTSAFIVRATGVSPGPGPSPMRIREGTTQQEAFWGELVAGDTHVMLEARAGTGKSTSCREGMHRIVEASPGTRCSYVAFNRAIADEFGSGLPPSSRATTMHSAGYAAIRAAFDDVGDPAKFKMHDIVDGLASFLPRREARKAKGATVKLASLCKSHLIGTDPRSVRYGIEPHTLDRLVAAHGIDVGRYRPAIYDLIPRVLRACMDRVRTVDFTDMPWLPVVLGLDFPPVDFLFIDEAQDLDPCQHALVRRIAGDGRLVVVGDPFQAIYAFRGADSASMDTLGGQLAADRRGLTRLPLTMTRRCPGSHVELARRIVPDFESLPDAPVGAWREDEDPDSALTPGVLALCRTNAPLVSACFRLIARGVPAAIEGRDLGNSLAQFVEDLEASTLPELMRKVELYRSAEARRLEGLENAEGELQAVEDRCNCIVAVSSGCETPADVARRIRSTFIEPTPANRGSMVILSSVHRAKGREAGRVAIICPELMPHKMARTDEARRQELNLLYVALTRSREDLAFCGPLPGPIALAGATSGPSSPSAPADDPPSAPRESHRVLPITELDRKRMAFFGLRVQGA